MNSSTSSGGGNKAQRFEWKLVVAGCGSSSSTPKLQCLLSGRTACMCQRSFHQPFNRRGNPSIVLSRRPVVATCDDIEHGTDTHIPKPSSFYNVLVDVGKTVRDSVLKSFLSHQIQHIDELVLTHSHFDAIGGLDEFRELQKRVQVPFASAGKQKQQPASASASQGTEETKKPVVDDITSNATNSAAQLRTVNQPTRLFMDEKTSKDVASIFGYVVGNLKMDRKAKDLTENSVLEPRKDTLLYVAQLQNWVMEPFVPFRLRDLEVIPIPMHHGAVLAMGFIFRTLGGKSPVQTAYFSDYRCKPLDSVTNLDGSTTPLVHKKTKYGVPILLPEDIEALSFLVDPERTMAILKRCPVQHMFLEALHEDKCYVSHSSLSETIQIVRVMHKKHVSPRHVWLTGMSCSMDYHRVNAILAKELADLPVVARAAHDAMVLDIDVQQPKL